MYKILVGDAPRGYARAVAAKMGVPYPTLSKYWLGKRRFPASLVKPLFRATDDDVRVAEFFVLDGSGYKLERVTAGEPLADVPRALLSLTRLSAEVAKGYLDATAEGAAVSAADAEAMRLALQRLVDHAERLRAALRPEPRP